MLTARRLSAAAVLTLLAAVSAKADSVWPKSGGCLFTDNKAYRVGDVITIVVNESAALSSSATSALSKESETQGEIETLDWPKGSNASKVFTGDPPKAKFGASRTFDGSGSYSMAGSMQTNLSAIVLEVLPNGNLVVEGSRLLESVDDKVIIRACGIVRPEDISTSNTVPSTALANGKIIFESMGPIARSNRRGFLNRLVDFIWPF